MRNLYPFATIVGALTLTTTAYANEINVMTWPSVAQALPSVMQDFKATTGSQGNIIEESNPLPRLLQDVRGGEGFFDLVTLGETDLTRACAEGLLVSLPKKFAELAGPATAPCGFPLIAYGRTIAFRSDDWHGDPPALAADLFDLDAYPGMRLLPPDPEGLLEIALISDGVPPEDVYATLGTAEGIDRAFASLDLIKDSATFSPTYDATDVLTAPEPVMAILWSSQLNNAIAEGAAVTSIPGVMIVKHDYLAMPVSASHSAEAETFLNYMSSEDAIIKMMREFNYRYSTPIDTLRDRAYPEDQLQWVQACPSGTCGCKGGGCSKGCCKSQRGINSLGHLKHDPLFWLEHGDDLRARFDSWRME